MSEENIGTPVSKPSGRIAKNTFLLLVRMFILMVINLYSLRILTNALGDDDYGLFNAVAGVVVMLTCVSTVFSISTQRFFSCELANNDNKKLSEIFSKSLNLNVALAFLTLVLFETIGLWYVSCKMIIPPDRVFRRLPFPAAHRHSRYVHRAVKAICCRNSKRWYSGRVWG